MFKKTMLETRGIFLSQQKTSQIQTTQANKRKERPVTIVTRKGTTNMSVFFLRNRNEKIFSMSRILMMQMWLNMKLSWL